MSDPSDSLQLDHQQPSILPLTACTAYTGVKLDKMESNFKIWKDDIRTHLVLNNLWGYAIGRIPTPNQKSEPVAFMNWENNNVVAAVSISSSIITAERAFINVDAGAQACWDVLIKQHEKEGPIRQVLLLQEALSLKCTDNEPLTETADKIIETIR